MIASRSCAPYASSATADESPRSRLGHQPQQLARELDGGPHVHRIDVDAEHADCASAFHALGCVVQEHDDARIDAHRLGCGEIGLGCGLAHADVGRVDEGVEVAELGPAMEELGAVDRIGVVREHPDRFPARLRGVHEGDRFLHDEAVGHECPDLRGTWPASRRSRRCGPPCPSSRRRPSSPATRCCHSGSLSGSIRPRPGTLCPVAASYGRGPPASSMMTSPMSSSSAS